MRGQHCCTSNMTHTLAKDTPTWGPFRRGHKSLLLDASLVYAWGRVAPARRADEAGHGREAPRTMRAPSPERASRLPSIALLIAILATGSLGLPMMAAETLPPSGSADQDGQGADVVSLDTAFRFDAEGLISLADRSLLPAVPGSISARWYPHRGWMVAVFEGLDLSDTGPLCLGTAAIDPATSLITQATYAPTAAGACDDSGAGTVPLASAETGVRSCGDSIAYVTRIPSEFDGPLVANVVTFEGDGTGTGISGRLELPSLQRELDPEVVACGPLPPERQPVARTPEAVPTPAPTLALNGPGTVAASERAGPPPLQPVEACPEAGSGELEEILASPAGPYLLWNPEAADAASPTIVFLPGGGGGYGAAQRLWDTVFADGAGFEGLRVVIPYAVDEDLIGQAMRTYAIIDEVLWCFGGNPRAVHLGGTSNGGLAAFGLMVREPTRFATLTGAPGAFPVQDPGSVDPEVWAEILAGRAVLNGVGEFDVDWRPEVMATHNALAAAGIESVYVEFPRQGHVAIPEFDSSALRAFWEAHS